MVISETVDSMLGGLVKVVKKKIQEGDQHIRITEEKYFLGMKYKETSKLRKSGVLDAWSGMLGMDR